MPIAQTRKENTRLAKLRAIGRSFQVEDNRAPMLGRYLSRQSRLADLTRAQQDDAGVEPQSLTQLSSKEAINHPCLLSDGRSFGKDMSPSKRIFRAARGTLSEWTDRLRKQAGTRFPEKLTAFWEGMAVHGRFGEPCRVCGSPAKRIVYAEHETNYCARCQTGGKILADRALSRLLKKSWPRNIDDLY